MQGVDAQREATHFKNRVLDLVDIFAKNQPRNPNVVRLILPLVELIASSSSDERQLSDKAKGVLSSRIIKSKENPSPIDTKRVAEILEALHTRARKVHTSDLLPTLSQSSLYVSKLLLHFETGDPVLLIYGESLMNFTTRKASTLNATFFQDFIRRLPSSAWSLRDTLLESSRKATNAYRQCQAFQLLQVLISQLPTLVSSALSLLFNEIMPTT
jgi:DNA polymerase phi